MSSSSSSNEGVTKEVKQLGLRITQLEEILSMQSVQMRAIITQNDNYVRQHSKEQEVIEKVQRLFKNESGEEITMNLASYLEQKITQKILGELKFNQITQTIESKFKESTSKLYSTCEGIKEEQTQISLYIHNLKEEMRNNTNLIYQTSLFAQNVGRIEADLARNETSYKELVDRVWKQDERVQSFQEKIAQKIEWEQLNEVQSRLNENFVGMQFFNSQFQLLQNKVNSKTDQITFEEKFNYIDKAILSSSQKFEEQFQRDLKIYLAKILEGYTNKQDLDNAMNNARKETRTLLQNSETGQNQKFSELSSLVQQGQDKSLKQAREIESTKWDVLTQADLSKAYQTDIQAKFQSIEKKIFLQSEDMGKKIDLKPSHKDVRNVIQSVEQKFIDQSTVMATLQTQLDEKCLMVTRGLELLQEKLVSVVTSEELDGKLQQIEAVKEEASKIIQDQEIFRSQIGKFEERLSVKISKFEIDQLRNAISQEYVKKPVFDESQLTFQALEMRLIDMAQKNKHESEKSIRELREEYQSDLYKSAHKLDRVLEKSAKENGEMQQEMNIIQEIVRQCKQIVQKTDESLLLKASKLDLEEINQKILANYLDKSQLIKFVASREEFNQMRILELDLKKFKQEYKLWRENFNQRMSFTLENNKLGSAEPFQWIEEMKTRINDFENLKISLSQKANHTDLIQIFSQKANKSAVDEIRDFCSMIRKQFIYQVISVQSYIKNIQQKLEVIAPAAAAGQSVLIQLNLRQLTKLLEWVSLSFEDVIPTESEKQPTTEESLATAYDKMKKIAESVIMKFKIFRAKKDGNGNYRACASENKMLDEYLSLISQEYNQSELQEQPSSQQTEEKAKKESEYSLEHSSQKLPKNDSSDSKLTSPIRRNSLERSPMNNGQLHNLQSLPYSSVKPTTNSRRLHSQPTSSPNSAEKLFTRQNFMKGGGLADKRDSMEDTFKNPIVRRQAATNLNLSAEPSRDSTNFPQSQSPFDSNAVRLSHNTQEEVRINKSIHSEEGGGGFEKQDLFNKFINSSIQSNHPFPKQGLLNATKKFNSYYATNYGNSQGGSSSILDPNNNSKLSRNNQLDPIGASPGTKQQQQQQQSRQSTTSAQGKRRILVVESNKN